MGLIDDLQAKMDAANASIQKNTDLDDSIIAMLTAETQQIKDLKAALDAAGTDPAKLQALGEAMDALIAKVRAAVERPFAVIKETYGLRRLRFFNFERNRVLIVLACCAYNLRRAAGALAAPRPSCAGA